MQNHKSKCQNLSPNIKVQTFGALDFDIDLSFGFSHLKFLLCHFTF